MDNLIHDDVLDRQLHESTPYIDDDGFTRRVLQQLPVHRAPQRLRGAILILVTLLATVLTYVLSGGGRFVTDAFVRLANLGTIWLLLVTFAAGLLLTVAGLAAAVSNTRAASSLRR
jgi:polyferredoxin